MRRSRRLSRICRRAALETSMSPQAEARSDIIDHCAKQSCNQLFHQPLLSAGTRRRPVAGARQGGAVRRQERMISPVRVATLTSTGWITSLKVATRPSSRLSSSRRVLPAPFENEMWSQRRRSYRRSGEMWSHGSAGAAADGKTWFRRWRPPGGKARPHGSRPSAENCPFAVGPGPGFGRPARVRPYTGRAMCDEPQRVVALPASQRRASVLRSVRPVKNPLEARQRMARVKRARMSGEFAVRV